MLQNVGIFSSGFSLAVSRPTELTALIEGRQCPDVYRRVPTEYLDTHMSFSQECAAVGAVVFIRIV